MQPNFPKTRVVSMMTAGSDLIVAGFIRDFIITTEINIHSDIDRIIEKYHGRCLMRYKLNTTDLRQHQQDLVMPLILLCLSVTSLFGIDLPLVCWIMFNLVELSNGISCDCDCEPCECGGACFEALVVGGCFGAAHG